MMKKGWCLGLLMGVCLIGLSKLGIAQSRINNLIFNSTDEIVGLRFTAPDDPQLFYTGISANATIGEGIAHAENAAGDIIFWVNSSGVYDRENNLMPASSGILAHPSSTEIVISPFPGSSSKYYLFYNNQLCSTLYYSVVDMGLRGGLGNVSALNIALAAEKSFAEGLEVIRIPCSRDYWLIANECGKGLTRFRVSEEGLSEGTFFLSNPNIEGGRGELDYHKGKLGYAITFHKSCLVADFDPLTGKASQARFISLPLQNGAYGLEFSPNATKLFVTDLNNLNMLGVPATDNLHAVDLSSGLSQSWRIGNTNAACNSQMEGLGHIEQGKDGKLYISQLGGCQVVMVGGADAAQPELTTIDVATVLSAGISDHIQSDFLEEDLLQEASIEITGTSTLCTTEPVVLKAVVSSQEDKFFQWYRDGNALPDATGTSYAALESGSYVLRISNAYGCSIETLPAQVQDNRIHEFNNQMYYEACGEEAVTIRYPAEGYEVVWFDGSEGYTKQVTESGVYQLRISNGNCSRTELIEVLIKPIVQYRIPNVITVNGDAKNEFFEIEDLQGPVRLWIYNRWGSLLYFSNDYQNNWQAEGLPVGTYFYRLLPDSNCAREQKGWVQLIRPEKP